jgi:allantoinase
MPLNSVPATTSVAALATKRAAAEGQCSVDVGFWGGAVPESLGHLAELWEAGVFGFKCFLLDSGVPEFPPLSATQIRAAKDEIAAFDGILIVHAEDPEVIAAHGMDASRDYDDFLASRPPEAETTAISTVIAAARETGCRAHVVHLSAAEALPEIAAARAEGVRLTVETCPHYLTLASESVPEGQTQFKCCPPVRGAANADLLWQALVDGVIDCVVSDHSPCTLDLKGLEEGDFGAAWGGISSLQLGLPLVWTEARRRGIDLATVVGWMSTAPARVVGVDRRGHIGVGAPADFAVLAPEETWTVRAAELQHRNAITPYEGRTLTGRVRRTYLDGLPVDLAGTPRGHLLPRQA